MTAAGRERGAVSAAFRAGEAVRIRAQDHPGHHRTPLYIKGKRGVIERYRSDDRNPETLAYGGQGLPRVPVYQVRFAQRELWPGYAGSPADTLVMDVFEHWLERAQP